MRSGTILVRVLLATDVRRVAADATRAGYTVERRVADFNLLELRPPPGVDAADAARRFALRSDIYYAEPLAAVHAADVPSDPLYPQQSAYLDAVHAAEAWDVETGAASVIVAVLDTGIDGGHPELRGRLWRNGADATRDGVDDDANGCIDDEHGCAFVGRPGPGCEEAHDGDIADDVGHGTFVSGIIAANADGRGLVGVARGVTIMPVKMLDCAGSGDTLALAQAVLYAAENGAKVLNVSLGGPETSELVLEAVRIARDKYGALIVAASGNSGGNGVYYPARYDEVLAVGAASLSDPARRAEFSTTGPQIDVVAIGEGIVGPVPLEMCGDFAECVAEGPYAAASGTSFAAPQVAGLVALLLSHKPGLPPESLIAIVKASADPVPPGPRPDWAGAGRINMLRALTPAFRLGAAGVAKNQ